MKNDTLIISKGNLEKNCLKGDVAVVTGSGSGIGFETARSLAWLGCTVIIAEINSRTGQAAQEAINSETGNDSALFIHTDLASEKSIKKLSQTILKKFSGADIIINNATKVAIGAINTVSLADWDLCYQVNLRAPITLVREFLPGMLERNKGTIICVSSSGAAPLMGAYEVFKTAQVELATTLSLELEKTTIDAFTIGPGLVRTPGAMASIEKLAPLYGQTVEEFFEIGKDWIISAEAAGAGFAAAAALSSRFRGQETSSRAALIEAGIDLEAAENEITGGTTLISAPAGPGTGMNYASSEASAKEASILCNSVKDTLSNLSDSWNKMNNFMKQWVLRDFKKQTGASIEDAVKTLDEMGKTLERGETALKPRLLALAGKLEGYYSNYLKQAEGYIKDPEVKKEQSELIKGWRAEVVHLQQSLEKLK